MNLLAIEIAKIIADNQERTLEPNFLVELQKELEHYGLKIETVFGKLELRRVRE